MSRISHRSSALFASLSPDALFARCEEPVTLILARDLPGLGGVAGDVLRYNPALPRLPWTHARRRALDPVLICAHYGAGAFNLLDVTPAFASAIARTVSRAAPAPRRAPPPPHLRVVGSEP